MPLHTLDADDARAGPLDDAYASSGLRRELPKRVFPDDEQEARDVYDALHEELMLDGNARQNLATFCTTWLEPEARALMAETVDKNMIDKDEYPQTAAIEERCVHLIADLWNAPDAASTIGCSTTGSSEAAMLAGMAMKWRWRDRRRADGQPVDRPNLVCGPVQICWHKFCRYWDVEIREIPMEGDRLLMTPEEVVARCDENTIGVVPTLGVTFTGQYEPVAEVCAALDALQEASGLDIPVHVDGASGGFLAPFHEPDLVWDFRLERVVSINASGHKFGLAPLGVGWVVWRDRAHLPDDLVFDVNYLGGHMPTFALNFSRPGGEIICQYYNFVRLGREGYRRIQSACYETARALAKAIERIGPFDILYDGQGGIPALCWSIRDGSDVPYTLFDLADRLRTRGWLVPAYTLPAHREDLAIQRILVRHGFGRDMAMLLVDDMVRAIEHLTEHAPTRSLGAGDAAVHDHSGR